ncbi:MAG: hypothetical protein ACTTJW_06350 [Sphaerochaeta sp.]
MKKFLVILLVMVTVAGTVFAASYGNKVRVKSIVGSITISDANQSAISSGKALYVLSLNDKTGVDPDSVDYHLSSSDISVSDVEVGFAVTQTVPTRTNESIDLIISAAQLSMSDGNGTHTTDNLEITNIITPAANVTVASDTATANTLTLKLQYQGASKEVAGGSTIATFNTTWKKKAALASYTGEYKADITLTYEVN